jgi:hypothetical protein
MKEEAVPKIWTADHLVAGVLIAFLVGLLAGMVIG